MSRSFYRGLAVALAICISIDAAIAFLFWSYA
jgi:hypothetical protein